jgi:hypothetical protein
LTTDSYRKHGRRLTTPPEEAVAIVPSDTAALGHVTRAVFVGEGGDLRVRMLGGGVVTLANLAPGALVPLRVTQVLASGTTASGLVALW